jgi:hypothetical protein
MIKIIDDFIPKNRQDEIEKFCTTEECTWFYGQNSLTHEAPVESGEISISKLNGFRDSFQFTHNVFTKDGTESFSKDFFLSRLTNGTALESVEFGRIKLNFTFPILGYEPNCPNFPHIDKVTTCPFTAIYYVNDSDGDTLVFNETYDKDKVYDTVTIKQNVSPKKGRLLIFNSDQLHTSSLPYMSDKRIVINLNFRNKIG